MYISLCRGSMSCGSVVRKNNCSFSMRHDVKFHSGNIRLIPRKLHPPKYCLKNKAGIPAWTISTLCPKAEIITSMLISWNELNSVRQIGKSVKRQNICPLKEILSCCGFLGPDSREVRRRAYQPMNLAFQNMINQQRKLGVGCGSFEPP